MLRPIAESASVELDLYHAGLLVVRGIVKYAKDFATPVIAGEIDRFHPKDEMGQNARQVIEAMKAEAARLEAQAELTSGEAMKKEGARHSRRWKAIVGAQAKIDVSLLLQDDDLVDLLSVKSEQFNALIRNMSADIRARIERETLGAIFEGRGTMEIAGKLEDIAGIGRARARLIARDQAAKLNSAMNQFRQDQAGITHYKWKTILDGRERPTHHANNGKVFAWDTPSKITGHPGHDIQCRCRSMGIMADPEDLEGVAELDDPDLAELLPDPEPTLKPGGSPQNADAWWARYGTPDLFKGTKAPGPVGGAHAKEFYIGPDGELWMFKPIGKSEAFRAMGEEAAYKVQRLVDARAIETRFIELNGKPGSIQRWQTGLADKIDYKGTPIKAIPEAELPQIQREHVVDWLISQHDSHAANFVRGKDGHVWGIDKGQVYRFLGTDRLSIDYHPNSIYGEAEPLYNTVFRAFSKGEIKLDMEVAIGHAEVLQAVPDDQFRAIIAPYVDGRFAGTAEREAFYKLALARKNGLVDELTAFYRGLDNDLTPEIQAVIADVPKAGWRGKAIPLDKDGIEDHNVLVTELHRDGKSYTVLSGKFREQFDAAIKGQIGKVSSDGPVGPAPLVPDDYHFDLFAALKHVNHAIDKGTEFKPERLAQLQAVKAKLAKELGSSDPARAAMAKYYAEWVDKVEAAVASKVKTPTYDGQFKWTPPSVAPPKAAGSMSVTKNGLSYEGRAVAQGGRLIATGGKHTMAGVQYDVAWKDGVTGYYRPWSGETAYAQRGHFEVVVEGKPSPATVMKAMKAVEQWGVDISPAKQVDVDLAYLYRQAAASSEHRVAGYKALVAQLEADKASVEARVSALVGYWQKKLGVPDLRKMPAWRPEGEYVRQGGQRVHYRFDVTDADIEREIPQFRLQHGNTQDVDVGDLVNQVLKTDGLMLSQTERLRVGIKISTMSPGKDMQTGGASYFFTRIKNISSPQNLSTGLYWKPRVLRRADAISYQSDKYGEVSGSTRAESHLAGISGWKTAAGGHGNETIFKGSLSILDDLDMIVTSHEAERQKVIAAFRAAGIDKIDGTALEARVVVARSNGKPVGLDNPELEKHWGLKLEPPGVTQASGVTPTSPPVFKAPTEYMGKMPLNKTKAGTYAVPSIDQLASGKGLPSNNVMSYTSKLAKFLVPGVKKGGPGWQKALNKAKIVFSQLSAEDLNTLKSNGLGLYWPTSDEVAVVQAKLKEWGYWGLAQ